MPNFIYALSDPRDDRPDAQAIRYIGQTGTTLERRLRGHLRDARSGRMDRKSKWIRSLLREGVIPKIEEIEEGAPRASLGPRERFWIAYYRAFGTELTNLTEGGEGVLGLRWSEESRAKLSAAKTGRKLGPRSPELIAKIAGILKGGKRSEETRKKMSDGQRARTDYPAVTPEFIAKCSAAQKGRPKSAEAKARMSVSAKARWAAYREKKLTKEISEE